jgi:FlaG/FlaF family flagellin (archaellin)
MRSSMNDMAADDTAVSPIVGVMLMLVVTIIIAAVVSAFAGGMVSEQNTAPQVHIEATYSQSDGMIIQHAGGDVLNTRDLYFTVHHTENMDSSQSTWNSVVNKSIIQSVETREAIIDDRGSVGLSRFAPGDTLMIEAANCTYSILEPNIGFYGHSYGIDYEGYQGATFFLELYTNDGKMIAYDEVLIEP